MVPVHQVTFLQKLMVICRISGDKIFRKRCKYNKNCKCKFVRYMRGITFSMYKITRYICIIVAINDVKITKIKGDLACGI